MMDYKQIPPKILSKLLDGIVDQLKNRSKFCEELIGATYETGKYLYKLTWDTENNKVHLCRVSNETGVLEWLSL